MAEQAGFGKIAEPPSKVAEGVMNAIQEGAFHVFPDSMAKQIGFAYESFAKNVIEAENVEA
jgi:hypothetical protein